MQSRPWHWRRLTDEQLEAAALRWSNLADEAYYANHTHALGRREQTRDQILAEMDRRHQAPQLFEERAGYDQPMAA